MKDFGVKPYLFPMPVYMIGTYNEDDTVDAMAMAWGGICAENMVALNLEEEHKTVANRPAAPSRSPSPAGTPSSSPTIWVLSVPIRSPTSLSAPVFTR